MSHGKHLLGGFPVDLANPLHLGFGRILRIQAAIRTHFHTLSFVQNGGLDATYRDSVRPVFPFEVHNQRPWFFTVKKWARLHDVDPSAAINREQAVARLDSGLRSRGVRRYLPNDRWA